MTLEGQRFWRIVTGAGVWAGGGMTPPRLDRAEIRFQLDGVPPWIITDLLNRFEPEALAAIAQAREAKSDDGSPAKAARNRARERRSQKELNP